jgi:hypothetical protein
MGLTVLPAVPVGLFGPGGGDDAVALFDTGSSYCLFNGTRAATLGLSLLDGRPIRIATLAGGFTPIFTRLSWKSKATVFGSK